MTTAQINAFRGNASGAAATAGNTGKGILGTLIGAWMNKRAREAQWGRDEYMLREGPSMYLEGMEKAGLNPLTMGSNMPASASKPSQSTPRVTDPMQAALIGAQLSKMQAETHHINAQADFVTSQKVGQNLDNRIKAILEQARSQQWKVTLAGKEFDLNAAQLESAQKAYNVAVAELTYREREIATLYKEAAIKYVREMYPNKNPEILKMQAMYVAIELMRKESKHFVTKMLTGAASNIGGKVVTGLFGGK